MGMNLGLYCCFKKVTAVTDANIGYTHYNLEALRSYHIHGRYVTYIPRCTVGGTIGEILLVRWKVTHDQQVPIGSVVLQLYRYWIQYRY